MKRILFGLIFAVLFSGLAFPMGSPPENDNNIDIDATTKATEHFDKSVLNGKTVLMVVASKDFNDDEYSILRNIFEEYGAKIIVASSTKGEIMSIKGKKITADILHKDVKVKDYNAFVFIGGPGAKEYFDDSKAHSIASWGFASRKPVAAISNAPVILANSGILGGKKATAHESYTETLSNEGAIYTGSEVEIYGNIITAKNSEASKNFAFQIIKYLSK